MLVTVCLPLFAAAALSQGFWAKKGYEEWSPRECEKMLNDSPWAKSRTFSRVLIEQAGDRSSVDGREENPQITYVAQLWSALPVRQAHVRQALASPQVTKLSAEDKKRVADQMAEILRADYSDRLAVRVLYLSNVPTYQRELVRYWRMRPDDRWKQDTFLITDRGRIPPIEVRVSGGAGGEFLLLFPRTVDGQPVVRPQDKSFSIEFEARAAGVVRADRALLQYKTKDIVADGQLIY